MYAAYSMPKSCRILTQAINHVSLLVHSGSSLQNLTTNANVDKSNSEAVYTNDIGVLTVRKLSWTSWVSAAA